MSAPLLRALRAQEASRLLRERMLNLGREDDPEMITVILGEDPPKEPLEGYLAAIAGRYPETLVVVVNVFRPVLRWPWELPAGATECEWDEAESQRREEARLAKWELGQLRPELAAAGVERATLERLEEAQAARVKEAAGSSAAEEGRVDLLLGEGPEGSRGAGIQTGGGPADREESDHHGSASDSEATCG